MLEIWNKKTVLRISCRTLKQIQIIVFGHWEKKIILDNLSCKWCTSLFVSTQQCWVALQITEALGCWPPLHPMMTGGLSLWLSRLFTLKEASRRPQSADTRLTAPAYWAHHCRCHRAWGRPLLPPANTTESYRTTCTTCWRDPEDGRSSTMPSCKSPTILGCTFFVSHSVFVFQSLKLCKKHVDKWPQRNS